ncbi:AAA family ATPase [Nocardia carnea]|uniref:AAA family ATPase n=1 Tax=Nocardia carnea TaxID=37328 RepID=UPI002458D9A2|nr:ATP-binding protein [Nocardia carnea]
MALTKPADMFDRDREWTALTAFATSSQPNATLGVVSGRRRQGKTFLLESLCEAADGFYFAADQATEAESLRYLAAAVADFAGARFPVAFDDWRQAVDALLALAEDRQLPVVIDEFPYLVKATPALPSIIQSALAPRRAERRRSRARLLLCGSAMSFMGSLLAGTAPLRGRAGLELIVPTLDYRLAAEFWELDDPRLAFRVHAVVGGTPAYRREFAESDSPVGLDDFDPWVLRTVLNPSSPLFREARYLLSEEPGVRDPGLYHSVLAAVAHGNATTGGIASYVGRKSSDIAHPLSVLEDSGLLRREPDVFRANRMIHRVAEPLITFYQALQRPDWAEWERGRDSARLWARRQHRFESNVLGPHFEQLCREWSFDYAPEGFFGGYVNRVGSGVVNDSERKASHEVDIAVFGERPDGTEALLSIGEVKWNDVMGTGHLERLRRIRQLLSAKFDTTDTRLACYSAAGFMPALHNAAAEGDVLLIGLEDLYR